MRRTTLSPDTSSAASARQGGWRRFQPPGIGVLFLVLAIPASGCSAAGQNDGPKDSDMTALPPEVREALDRAAEVYPRPLGGARWSQARQLGETDHTLFQIQGTNGRGNKIEIEVTGAGRVIELEEHGIPLGEVPGAVVEALKARMPRFEPARVEAIYQAEKGQPVSYGFEGADAGGKQIEVYISADGKT